MRDQDALGRIVAQKYNLPPGGKMMPHCNEMVFHPLNCPGGCGGRKLVACGKALTRARFVLDGRCPECASAGADRGL